MKNIVFFLFVFFSCLLGNAQKIVLNGNYQGKNLYIQNPLSKSSNVFCTDSVFVNGKEIYFKNESVYEIKLDSLGFKLGDSVTIEIFHKKDCRPSALIDISTPKNKFQLDSIHIDTLGVLYWKSKNEIGKLPFIIEQFRWNKWVKVGQEESKGDGANEYTFKTPAHSGENKVRIKQQDALGLYRLSKTVTFNNDSKKVKLKIQRLSLTSSILEFDKETMYEIFDQWGNVVKKGTAIKVDCTSLPRGAYYINYDNEMGEFVKY